MDQLFDEFSKSLAESVPRRESLRRLGAVFAGATASEDCMELPVKRPTHRRTLGGEQAFWPGTQSERAKSTLLSG
jgi:hypothetical protein